MTALLTQAEVPRTQILAIGNHGQTIRHRPNPWAEHAFPYKLATTTTWRKQQGYVVGDFRGRDIAVGGQGAPLVPGFHQAVFGSATASRQCST